VLAVAAISVRMLSVDFIFAQSLTKTV